MESNDMEIRNEIEITSVGSFINEVKELRDKTEADGISTQFYFRGQEVAFWGIEPSVFRNDMLSTEHNLMLLPLQNNPFEFYELKDPFEIMAKYQHYGMCTRLLDLTTNPLVALYFACKTNKEFNRNVDKDDLNGIVYFINYYPSQVSDFKVKIITTLAKYDLNRENTIKQVLIKLLKDGIISAANRDKWLDEEGVKEFIDILQNDYLVVPIYSNERLRKQSGVFLLVSAFTIEIAETIEKGIITKSRKDLKSEFNNTYFYIREENKSQIIKELDSLGINESTLFPELEHQLNYIKFIHQDKTQPVSDFHLYEEKDTPVISYDDIDESKLNEEFIHEIKMVLTDRVDYEDEYNIINLIKENLVVDWFRRSMTRSKIKTGLITYCLRKSIDKNDTEFIVDKIMSIMNVLIKKHMIRDEEGV